MKSLPPAYLCHEYFNENWDTMFFTDVVDLLGPAKVSFAASANPLDAVSGLGMTQEAQTFLASPVTGGGIPMTRVDQLLLGVWGQGGDIPGTVWKIMKDNGEKITKNGVALEQDAECVQAVAAMAEELQKRLPLLKALGVADARLR